MYTKIGKVQRMRRNTGKTVNIQINNKQKQGNKKQITNKLRKQRKHKNTKITTTGIIRVEIYN